MISLITPPEALLKIAKLTKERRLFMNITQSELSDRSGVSLSVIRKFERTGKISLESFLKLSLVLDFMHDILKSLEINVESFSSVDEIMASNAARLRKRARR